MRFSALKRKPRRGPDGKFKAKLKIQDRPREHGRFVSSSGISHLQLTEGQIRPYMRYCRITAAEMLKISTYQLSMACSRLGLKWPRWPEVPTPEHHKALNRKKKKEKIPKNSVAFVYCEKEEESTARFHELRISFDGRAVFTRWGRPGVTNNYAWRANKKTRFATKEEALVYCRNLKAQWLSAPEGWLEKTAPILPNSKPKSKRKAILGMQTKRKLFKDQNSKVREMQTQNLITAGTYAQEEIDAENAKLEIMRTNMYRAVRQAKGLVEATKEQRVKVANLKAANIEKPGTHTDEELQTEMTRLRELMSKYSKRTLVAPIGFGNGLRKHEDRPQDEVRLHDAKRQRGPDLGPLSVQAPAWRAPESVYPPPPRVVAPTLMHVWCTGSCARLRKPWCTCSNVDMHHPPPQIMMPPHPMMHPMAMWHYYQQQHAAAHWHQQQQHQEAAHRQQQEWQQANGKQQNASNVQVLQKGANQRGLGMDGMYYGGFPFGPMHLRALGVDEARLWPLICLPDGVKLSPNVVGVRADPSNPKGNKTVSTPLYYVQEVFELVANSYLSKAERKKKWDRLFKSGGGKDGPLMEYALCIPPAGGAAFASSTATASKRSDALVNFNGIVLIIDAVGNEAAQILMREGAFFQQPHEEVIVLEPLSELEGLASAGAPPMIGMAAVSSATDASEHLALANEGDEMARQALKLFAQVCEGSESHVCSAT